ncbi:hypothetical protein L1987_87979 [Smallanthus sonchifolius]|nr:hypothetical protein L1987_87979 [Smallanthus sonchifolius]
MSILRKDLPKLLALSSRTSNQQSLQSILRLCYHDADTQGNSRRISCWKPTKGQGMYRYLARSSIEIAKIRMQFGALIGLCNMGIFFYAYRLQKISREG